MKVDLFKTTSLSITWLWLILFAVIPLTLILAISFTKTGDKTLITYVFNIKNYADIFSFIYLKIFTRSFVLAGFVTLVSLIIGYPFAYIIARSSSTLKNILLLFVIIPFWTSSLIRTYAMIAILKTKGLLNALLLWLGIIHTPLQILYTNTAVIIGLVYSLLPFMILPLYANIERMNYDIIEAAQDLGANWYTTFTKVIIPQTLPGIISGCIIVFLPAVTLFYIPEILGGAKSILLGNLIQEQFLFANDWPQGAATSVVLTLMMLILLWLYWRNTRAKDRHVFV